MYNNLLLNCDSYKVGMDQMYPPGTEYVYSYIESRGGRYDRTLFFGLQMYLKEYLSKPITRAQIDEAEEFWTMHGEPFNRDNWDYILDTHNGYLPVSIRAVNEGMVIPTHNVLVTIVNTDPKCYWLPTFLETSLIRAVWYPTSVATVSWHCKQIIKKYLEMTADDPESKINFALHCFGARACSSFESSMIGGCAHLVNFMGTDTASGIMGARKYYGEKMAGFSVIASEHSCMTSWGKDNEIDAFRNMLTKFAKPGAIVACVSDSYDIYHAARELWGTQLKDEIINSGVTLVVRPDSGNPTVVPVDLIEIFSEKFGFTTNSKGYKVLPPCIRVIQGDGIDGISISLIHDALNKRGFSTENLPLGMGNGGLNDVTRDTQKFAMKCSAVRVNGVWRDVFKDPITDPGKTSKKGRLALTRENGKYETVALEGNSWRNLMNETYRNGELLVDHKFQDIRDRSNEPALD